MEKSDQAPERKNLDGIHPAPAGARLVCPELKTQDQIIDFAGAVSLTGKYGGWVSRMFDLAHQTNIWSDAQAIKNANQLWIFHLSQAEREAVLAAYIARRLDR